LKKPIALTTSIIVVITGLFLLFPRNTMKLVHKKTGYIIAKKTKDHLSINDPFILEEIKLKGISIPLFLRSQFNGHDVIKMGDPLFNKAFEQVYIKFAMKADGIDWQN